LLFLKLFHVLFRSWQHVGSDFAVFVSNEEGVGLFLGFGRMVADESGR
jgi:hypothetical protein